MMCILPFYDQIITGCVVDERSSSDENVTVAYQVMLPDTDVCMYMYVCTYV